MIYTVELRDVKDQSLLHADELETDITLDDEQIIDFVHRVITNYDLDTYGPDDYTVTLRLDKEDNG